MCFVVLLFCASSVLFHVENCCDVFKKFDINHYEDGDDVRSMMPALAVLKGQDLPFADGATASVAEDCSLLP